MRKIKNIRYLGEQLTFYKEGKVYYMEIIYRKNKEMFAVEVDVNTERHIKGNISNLVQLTEKKLLSEIEKGRSIKDIIKTNIKIGHESLANEG